MAAARVLLVDDEPDFVDYIRSAVEESGVTVDVAYNGLEALAAIADSRPDVVVTDVVMPKMDGIELVKEINKIDDSIMVITVTGYPDWNDKVASIKESVRLSFLKPIRIEDVISGVEICLTVAKSS